jgi:hypothetical protein
MAVYLNRPHWWAPPPFYTPHISRIKWFDPLRIHIFSLPLTKNNRKTAFSLKFFII